MNPIVLNDGIGDALRAAAMLWRTVGSAGERTECVRVEPSPGDGAAEVMRSLSFVDRVEAAQPGDYLASRISRRRWLADPESWVGGHREGRPWEEFKRHACDLTLPIDAFAEDWLDAEWQKSTATWAGAPYTVVQPATSQFKTRRLQLTLPADRPFVLLGSEADRAVDVHVNGREFTEHDAFYLDLRGHATLREALSWVWCADSVIGVESWVAIAGALFGKPVVQEIDARAWVDLAPQWHVMFPTMGFRLIP